MTYRPARVPLPLRVVSVYALLSAVVLAAFSMLLLVHVRRDSDPDGIWLVPTTAAGCAVVGVLVRRPKVWAWVVVVLVAGVALVFGVPSRLSAAVVIAVLLLPSSLRHMGLLPGKAPDQAEPASRPRKHRSSRRET